LDMAAIERSSSSCMAVSTAGMGAWVGFAAASVAKAAAKIVMPVTRTRGLGVVFIVAQSVTV
jgi:hypothetical protein